MCLIACGALHMGGEANGGIGGKKENIYLRSYDLIPILRFVGS